MATKQPNPADEDLLDVLNNHENLFADKPSAETPDDITVVKDTLSSIESILEAELKPRDEKRPPREVASSGALRNRLKFLASCLPHLCFFIVGLAIMGGLIPADFALGRCVVRTDDSEVNMDDDDPTNDKPKVTGFCIRLTGHLLGKLLFFIGLRLPLQWVATLITPLLGLIATNIGLVSGNVPAFLASLRSQTSALLAEIGWLVSYYMLVPEDAMADLMLIENLIWYVVWWRVVSLMTHALKKWLSLKFYHKSYFKEMMVALVHERVLSLLVKPVITGVGNKHATTTAGGRLEKVGWPAAHFAAMDFVQRVLQSDRLHYQLNAVERDELVFRLRNVHSSLERAVTAKIDEKRAAGRVLEADVMQDELDAFHREAGAPDLNVVRVELSRRMARKWRAKAARARDQQPLLTQTLQGRTRALGKQRLDSTDIDRVLGTWSSLGSSVGSLAAQDADVIKHARTFSAIEEQLRHKTLQVSYLDEDAEESSRYKISLKRYKESSINTSAEARKLAYFLFFHLKADPESLEVTAEDLDRVLPAGTAESEAAWTMLDSNGNGAVSLTELVERVVEIYRKRKNLAATLLDTEVVVKQCFFVIRILAVMLWLFLPMAFTVGFDEVRAHWEALLAPLIALSFVFGNSGKELWEAAVYLFATHPFAVGDLIQVGTVASTTRGDMYEVKKIALSHLKVQRMDNAVCTLPLHLLRGQVVHNVTRSDAKWDSFKVNVDMGTTLENLRPVALAVRAHIAAHPKLFGGWYRTFLTAATASFKLELVIAYNYSNNGTELLNVSVAKSGLFSVISEQLIAAGIQFTLPHQKGPFQDPDAHLLPTRMAYATAGPGPADAAAGAGAQGSGADKAVLLAGGGLAAVAFA